MLTINISNFNSSLKYIIPETYLVVMILVIILISVLLEKVFSYNSRKILFLNYIFCVMILTIIAVLFYFDIRSMNLFSSSMGGGNLEEEGAPLSLEVMLFNNSYRVNSFISFIKEIVTILALLCLLNSYEYIKDEKNLIKYEFMQLFLLATLSIYILISANDFIAFFMGLELQAFSLYVLATLKKNKNFSTEAGLKYFIIGGVSSAFFLLGVSLIYGNSGLINYDDIYIYLNVYMSLGNDILGLYGLFFGFILITIAIFIKIGVAPFQFWVPDVYEGVATPIMFYLSIVPKVGMYFVLFRLYYYVFVEFTSVWKTFLLMGVIASLLIGSVGALYQTKLKRLMAYSGISHVGFILMGILCNDNVTLSMFTVLIYIIIYSVLVSLFFFILVKLRMRNSKIKIRRISDLRGLYFSNKALSITLSLNLFSLAGIPPLAGFFSKLYILMVAISSIITF